MVKTNIERLKERVEVKVVGIRQLENNEQSPFEQIYRDRIVIKVVECLLVGLKVNCNRNLNIIPYIKKYVEENYFDSGYVEVGGVIKFKKVEDKDLLELIKYSIFAEPIIIEKNQALIYVHSLDFIRADIGKSPDSITLFIKTQKGSRLRKYVRNDD